MGSKLGLSRRGMNTDWGVFEKKVLRRMFGPSRKEAAAECWRQGASCSVVVTCGSVRSQGLKCSLRIGPRDGPLWTRWWILCSLKGPTHVATSYDARSATEHHDANCNVCGEVSRIELQSQQVALPDYGITPRVGNRAMGELQHIVTVSISSAPTASLMNVFFSRFLVILK
jgi:hypothetical protein